MIVPEKTFLEPHEVLIAAYSHLIQGIDQHHLATIYNVNPGRIAEAVVALRWAIENHKELYHRVADAKKDAKAAKAAEAITLKKNGNGADEPANFLIGR